MHQKHSNTVILTLHQALGPIKLKILQLHEYLGLL